MKTKIAIHQRFCVTRVWSLITPLIPKFILGWFFLLFCYDFLMMLRVANNFITNDPVHIPKVPWLYNNTCCIIHGNNGYFFIYIKILFVVCPGELQYWE